MRPRHIFLAITVVSTLSAIARADDEYDKLKARFDETMRKYHEQSEADAKKAGWENRSLAADEFVMRRLHAIRGVQSTPRIGFRDEFFKYAQNHAGTPAALKPWALAATMSECVHGDNGYIETSETTIAIERLCSDHAADPGIVTAMEIIRQHGFCLRFESRESFYKAIEAKNKDPELIARARLARADLHLNPVLNGKYAKLFGGQERPEQVQVETDKADAILRGLVKDYPATNAGKSAEARLLEKEHIQVGKKLPEFEGKDFSGKLVQLSQFRGKVVMVVFWASWCGPCMGRIPEEREIATKFVGRPFTILGVNSDRTRAAFRKVMAKEALPWPNIFDGDPKTGPIATALRIHAFPTVLLLDHDGVIRYKKLYGDRLEKAIEELLEKVPKSPAPATSQPAV